MKLKKCGVLAAVLTLCVLPGLPAQAADAGHPSLYALIVGGGPDETSNAAQIEGHTRFAASLVAPPARRIVLFADGKADHDTVLQADTSESADAERALAVLLGDNDADEPTTRRAPKLGATIDGPASMPDFRRSLGKLSAQAAKAPAPLLLYFAGHGREDKKDARNTRYELWNNENLPVRILADEMARVPRPVPVVLIMAQCFSGAFANVLFTHGDGEAAPIERDVVGFFSARSDREAAGCSYATERADYQDFSSYFLGALCGRDRFGDPVTGADYDGDGQVTLHEAFCYTLIHDRSGDTPVCTSDTFLRRFAYRQAEIVYAAPYPEIWQAGTPAQRAVLDTLSAQLGLTGDTRALAVYDRLTYYDPSSRPALLDAQQEEKARLRAVRERALGPLFERWPVLRWGGNGAGQPHEGHDGVVAELTKNTVLRAELLKADKASRQADEAIDTEEAALVRFAAVYEHIVEANHLRAHGEPADKARFERLWRAEGRVLPLAR